MTRTGGRPRTRVATVVAVLLVAGLGVGLWLAYGVNGSSTTTTALSGPTTIPFSMKHNAFQDATQGSCTHSSGEYHLAGTIRNSATTTRRYQVVVVFVTVPGNTVEDTQVVNLSSVRSHESELLHPARPGVEYQLTLPPGPLSRRAVADGPKCVPLGERA